MVLEVLKWLPFITQQRRSYSGVFAGKYGLITLRDLFRWAERYRKSENAKETFYDWEQHLAEDGMWLGINNKSHFQYNLHLCL